MTGKLYQELQPKHHLYYQQGDAVPDRTSRLQEMLRERREREALDRIRTQLAGIFAGRGLPSEQVPAWVIDTVRGFWFMSAEPAAVLSDDAATETLDAWIEESLARHGISGGFYVMSQLELLPWLECEVPERDWMSRIREALDNAWVFLSLSLDVVVAVSEQEYDYQLFVGTRP